MYIYYVVFSFESEIYPDLNGSWEEMDYRQYIMSPAFIAAIPLTLAALSPARP